MSPLKRFLRNNSAEEGFTLLEVIIAIAIMVMALGSILTVQSGSLNASAKAREMNIVAMLAKSKMVDIEGTFEGKPFNEVKKEDGGAFPAPYEEYRWTTLVKEIEFPNLSATAPTQGGGDSAGGGESAGGGGGQPQAAETLTRLVTNFLSKAVREVTVTVIWKRGTNDQKFSLTTYWVDLNHEFSLSE